MALNPAVKEILCRVANGDSVTELSLTSGKKKIGDQTIIGTNLRVNYNLGHLHLLLVSLAEPLTVDDVRELAFAIPQMLNLTIVEFKGLSPIVVVIFLTDLKTVISTIPCLPTS